MEVYIGIILTVLVVGIVALIIAGVYSVRPKAQVERRVVNVMTTHRRRSTDPEAYYAKHGKDAWGEAH